MDQILVHGPEYDRMRFDLFKIADENTARTVADAWLRADMVLSAGGYVRAPESQERPAGVPVEYAKDLCESVRRLVGSDNWRIMLGGIPVDTLMKRLMCVEDCIRDAEFAIAAGERGKETT